MVKSRRKVHILTILFLFTIMCVTACKKADTEASYDQRATYEEPTTSIKATTNIQVTTNNQATTTESVTARTDKRLVCIDPGHQAKGNNDLEPIGPGATETKKKVSYGTKGVATGIAEYQLNLDIANMLEQELVSRGISVVKTRNTNDVDISNVERAKIGNESNADITVRIHANGSSDGSVKGVTTIYPSTKNPYCANISERSKMLSTYIVNSICEKTKASNRGAKANDTYTGCNWSTIPVTIVEMGFMSNPEEDKLMATSEYRHKIVIAIADGIESYFAEINH